MSQQPLPKSVITDIIIDGCAYHTPGTTADQKEKFLQESLEMIKPYRPNADKLYMLKMFSAAHKKHS